MQLTGEPHAVKILCISCLVTTIIFNLLAFFEFLTNWREFSLVDYYIVSTYVAFYVYYAIRMQNPEVKALPQFNSPVDEKLQGWLSILTCFIFFGSVLKALNLFKWHNQVSKLSKLITAVMATVVTLLTFFVGWILVFALLF